MANTDKYRRAKTLYTVWIGGNDIVNTMGKANITTLVNKVKKT